MARGRPPRTVPAVRWNVLIPKDLAERIEELLFDPLRRGTAYGARSKLITHLLRRWLSDYERRKDGTNGNA